MNRNSIFLSLFFIFSSLEAGKVYVSVVFNQTPYPLETVVYDPTLSKPLSIEVPAFKPSKKNYSDPILIGTFSYEKSLDRYFMDSYRCKLQCLENLLLVPPYSFFFTLDIKKESSSTPFLHACVRDCRSNIVDKKPITLPENFSEENDIFLQVSVAKTQTSEYSVTIEN